MANCAKTWDALCSNAEKFDLPMHGFTALENSFRSLDPVFFSNCADSMTTGKFPFAEVEAKLPEGEREKFYLFCAVANHQSLVEYYEKGGYPQEMMRDVQGDLKLWMEVGMRDYGFFGISSRIFHWQIACFTGDVKQTGRLQFNDIHDFFLKWSLYRQADQTLKVLPAFQKDNPANPDLTWHDKAFSLHIPASGPLKAQDCKESIRRMFEFSAKFHPDYNVKAAVCYSWLLDPVFQKLLPEHSNIVQFQKLGYLLPWADSDQTQEVIWRIWGAPGLNMPVEQLPAKTGIEKGVKSHLLAGGKFIEGVLIIFPDQVCSW